MELAIIIFWACLAVLFFCYIGYGIILFFLNAVKLLFKPRQAGRMQMTEWPSVTMIIAAYNEGIILSQKLENTLAIDYPPEKLRIIIVTDGSTDGSENRVSQHKQLLILHSAERQGKFAAINRAMQHVETELVIFSDANTMLNKECIKMMITHYDDPRIGGVAGEKKIISNREGAAIGEAEGMYWQYESFMKKQDSDFNTVVGAAGELFSIRTRLFDLPSGPLLLDDFIISMRVCLQGYKIKYEPGAFATELPSASLGEEAKRKIRISAGAYQSIGYLKEALNIFKYPLLGFQYISRRLLRWIFCPWMMILLLVINIIIVNGWSDAPVFYSWFLYTQLIFYSIAALGWILIGRFRQIGIIAIPFYFLFMNYCLLRGLMRFLGNSQPVLWERSLRQEGNVKT